MKLPPTATILSNAKYSLILLKSMPPVGRNFTCGKGIKEAGIRANLPVSALYDDQLKELISLTKGFTVRLTEPLGMDAAQVTAGGIVTNEFDPTTMESKLVPGLYACGEVLDVDGDCGGYNLQWAWSSGRLAGISAGKE